MQKWYPESFSNEDSTATAQAPQTDFEGLMPEEDMADFTPSLTAQFRSESGFLDSGQLMNNLTREERAQVFDLVEQDVLEQYNIKTMEMTESFNEKIEIAQKQYDESINIWAREINRFTEQELKKSSVAAARLAIMLAEKIIRCHVAIDEGVLARTLETSMFKIQSAEGITVTVNPEDVKDLKGNSELLKNLNIAAVESDRRIQCGGCLVRNSEREWDATIESQLGSLAELVEEMISTSEGPKISASSPSEKGETNELD